MTRVHGIGALLLGLAAVIVVGTAVVLLRPDGEDPQDATPVRIERTEGPGRAHSEEVVPRTDEAAGTTETLTARSPEPEDISALMPPQIAGRVRDRETGEAIEAFQVFVLPHEPTDPLGRTDQAVPTPFRRASGVFRLDEKPGIYDVVVTAPGHHPIAHAGVSVPPREHKPPIYELTRGAGIGGVVVGMPLKHVPLFLEVTWIDPGHTHPTAMTTRSGADGRFIFSPLPPGEYIVRALEIDNTTDRVGAIRVRDEVVEISVPVGARHQVTIAVKNDEGRPVDNALVELRSTGTLASATTAYSGLAVLNHLRDGEYQLRVSRFGFEDATDEISLHGGTGFEVRWVTLQDLERSGR